MDDGQKTVWDWGGAPLAPSVRRIDPKGWLCASLVAGAVAGACALMAAWRPIPGLATPPGALGDHAAYWVEMAAHAGWRRLFPNASAEYADFWSRLSDAERRGFVWRWAFGCWAFLMPSVFLAGPFLRPRDGLQEIRGSRRHEGKNGARRLVAKLAGRVARRPDHEVAPGVSYPAELWTRGTLVVGGVGSGKSTCLRPLIDKVVMSGEQMLLFDAKSEFTSGWARPAILAPWDARSVAWDIAKDMRNILDMERFAATMVQESSDPMWSSASRQILVGLMLGLRGARGDDWGWADLRDALSMPHPQLLAEMEEWHPLAARSLAKASVTSAGILINLAAFCAPIFHLAEAWGSHPPSRRVSIVEWTHGRSRHKQIVLQGHGAYGALARACAEGVVGVFASLVSSVEMGDDPSRKIWFIADEAAQLGEIPMGIVSLGRSRGVRAVIATQDLAQLEEIYGAPAVKALVSMVGTLIVGQTMQGESAELLCKAFGTREVERSNLSTPQGGAGSPGHATLSFSRDEVPLYKPSELSSRLGLSADGKSVKLILFTGGEAYELSWPLFEMRARRPAHAPAEWTRGARAATRPTGMGGQAGSDLTPLLARVEIASPVAAVEESARASGREDEFALPDGDASTADGLDDEESGAALDGAERSVGGFAPTPR